MKLNRFLFVLFLIFLNEFLAISQTGIDTSHTALVYGVDNSFTVKAPNGWVLDTKSGKSSGLFAVFYEEGSNWKDAISVMYCNTASKKAKGNETLEEVINFDVNRFKSTGGAVKDGDPMVTGDGKNAVVKIFFDKQNNNFESVAYIDEKNVVVFLVLSSRTEESFVNAFSFFKDFVGSYSYLTDNVPIDK